MTIPNNPAPGREWTNDVTGVTYRWDGERWFIVAQFENGGVSSELFTYTTGRLQTGIEENYLHNLAQDTSIDGIKNDIIELEEEIDALAPSVERGSWGFTLSGVVSNPGIFTAYDQYVATSGNPIGLVTNIKSLWFHSIDNSGTPHGFDNVVPGDLIELFVEGKAEYGLFKVVEVHDFTGGAADYWVIDVDFVRTLEATTRFDNSETCRVKIFKEPEGGTADGFVLKSGDTMTGDLEIKTPDFGEAALTLSGKRDNTNNACATVAFKSQNDPTDAYAGYLTYRTTGSAAGYFKFNQDVDLNNKGLHSVAQIRMQPGGYIGSAANPRLTFNNATSGQDGEGLLAVPRPADNRRSFSIRGNDADGTEQDMFYTFTNISGTPDAVNYVGKMDTDTNLVNKSYVDDKMAELLAKIEELEMTSGTTESYQFQMYNKTLGGSTEIGSQLFVNDIMSCQNDGDEWNGQDTHLLSSEYRHIYVCFENGYQLNPTGQMSVVGYSNSNQYDVRNSNVGTYNISGVEVCPPDKSSGKNIYRAVIQLDAYKPSGDSVYPSWGQGNLYITFSGGALTKTSA